MPENSRRFFSTLGVGFAGLLNFAINLVGDAEKEVASRHNSVRRPSGCATLRAVHIFRPADGLDKPNKMGYYLS